MRTGNLVERTGTGTVERTGTGRVERTGTGRVERTGTGRLSRMGLLLMVMALVVAAPVGAKPLTGPQWTVSEHDGVVVVSGHINDESGVTFVAGTGYMTGAEAVFSMELYEAGAFSSDRKTVGTGTGNDKTVGTGTGNDKTVGTGTGNGKTVGTGTGNGKTVGTGTGNGKTVGTGTGNAPQAGSESIGAVTLSGSCSINGIYEVTIGDVSYEGLVGSDTRC